MININYTSKGIKVETLDLLSVLSEDQLPLTFQFVRSVNKKIIWDVKLISNSWAGFPDNEMIDVLIIDNKGNQISEYKWDVLLHGDLIYQKFYNYFLNNKNTKGIAIGTHNGEFGEWVPVALQNLSEITLIEASKFQYNELVNNFSKFSNLKFINELVTVNGKDTLFYEGGNGYTNSVLKRVTEYWETDPITETPRSSLKFSNLITEDISWIHLDCEGIDYNLIMSLEESKLTQLDLILFEYNNSSSKERNLINEYLISKGYQTYKERGVSIAFKK
jgi:hypothetical protein